MKPKTPKPALAGQKKLTLRDACEVSRCSNAAGPRGFCRTCWSQLSRAQKLKVGKGSLLHWAKLRIACRLVRRRHMMRRWN